MIFLRSQGLEETESKETERQIQAMYRELKDAMKNGATASYRGRVQLPGTSRARQATRKAGRASRAIP